MVDRGRRGELSRKTAFSGFHKKTSFSPEVDIFDDFERFFCLFEKTSTFWAKRCRGDVAEVSRRCRGEGFGRGSAASSSVLHVLTEKAQQIENLMILLGFAHFG